MSNIQALTDINYVTVFLGVIIILFAIKEIIELIVYFKKKFRITTGIEEDKAEEEKRIKTLEAHDRWQYNEIQKFGDILKDLQENFVDDRINTLRWRILDFSSGLSGGRKYNKEAFEQIIKMDEKYEAILTKYKKTNDVINESMKFIKDKYQEKLRNGEFD